MASNLAARWQQIQGSDNWDGLLAPLDDTLRGEIIRYGEFVQAVYDGINNVEELNLRYYPLYGKSKLFNSVGLQRSAGAAYTITRYLYCTENTDGMPQLLDVGETKSVWMGFIAVSNDAETSRLGRRDIVITFRGTLSNAEWIYNIEFDTVSFPDLKGSTTGAPLVHNGFLALYNTAPSASNVNGALQVIATKSLRVQVMDELRSLLAKYQGETLSVTVVGHSLGGALATLCAYDIAKNGVKGSAHLAAFTYASPKVGGDDFRRQCDEVLGVRILRLLDRCDVVPLVPPPAETYKHPGVELRVDGSQSPYIKYSNCWQLGNPHNLERYLHTVAGFGKYVAPKSVANSTSVIENVVKSLLTFVAKTTTSASFAVIDKLVAPLINGDSEGLRVYNALKTLFAKDPDSLLDLVLNRVDITPSSSGTTADADFWLRIDRDIALVNKSSDLLNDSYGIPAEWWVVRNKGMLQNESDGKWHPAYLDLLTNLAADSDFL